MLDRASGSPASGPTPAAWPAVEPAAELLSQLRLSGVVYCRSELTAPWGLSLPAMPGCMAFHLVVEGRAELCDSQQRRHALQRGDAVLITQGLGHALRSDDAVPAPDLFSLPRQSRSPWYEHLRHGGGGASSVLLCGAVRVDDAVARRLVRGLPPVIVAAGTGGGGDDWLALAMRLLADESARPSVGAESVITRLADIVVVQLLRGWLAQDPQARQGWVAALRDRHLGPALQALHADPARPWTLATLARGAGLSRSALAERFLAQVGCTPMEYLTELRLHMGLDLLQAGALSTAEVAERCGYASDAAFSRAFKRLLGLTPGQARRSGPASVNSPSSS